MQGAVDHGVPIIWKRAKSFQSAAFLPGYYSANVITEHLCHLCDIISSNICCVLPMFMNRKSMLTCRNQQTMPAGRSKTHFSSRTGSSLWRHISNYIYCTLLFVYKTSGWVLVYCWVMIYGYVIGVQDQLAESTSALYQPFCPSFWICVGGSIFHSTKR